MSRGRHTGQRARRYRRGTRLAVAGTGALLICAGSVIAVHIGAFFLHSATAGGDLVGQERRAIAGTAGRSGACQSPPGSAGVSAAGPAAPQASGGGGSSDGAPGGGTSGSTGPAGLLEAPALGMTAPVLQGTGDAVLNDAVGHDAASVWPGQPGTSVLSAHDVTWFSRIGRLKPGDAVRYVTPCWTYTYTVTAHAIVKAGAPVYSTGAARLVLDTCYPLDALYITPTRYLVYASLASTAPTHAAAAVPAGWTAPAVPAPSALAAQGLTLAANSAPLGTLRLSGSPARAWAQSSAPLQFEAAALAAYFGLVRSAAQQRAAWWADLAPSVPVTAAGPLWGRRISSYVSPLTVTLHAAGAKPVSAALAATVAVTGAGGAARYDLAVTEAVSGGELVVTRVRMPGR